jgi:penicillin-binding protein 1A
MDIRLSDGDRIGKPQGKSRRRAGPAESGPVEPTLEAPTGRARGRSELRSDTRPAGRAAPVGDLIADRDDGGNRRRRGKGKTPPPKRGRGKPERQRRRRRNRFGLFGRLIYWLFILGFWGFAAVAGIVVYYGAQLPNSSTWAIPPRPPNIRILAADGTLISDRGKSGGEAVSLHDLPYYVPAAVIAIEDRRFMSHWGIDPIGLAAAAWEDITTHHVTRGGSTITQQLAKNLFLTRDQTLGRKVQEALLALWLERNYTKEQILELYLNRVAFGHQKIGIEAASEYYFGHPARELTLAEAATLAGSLKAPSVLNPKGKPALVSARQRTVLQAMADEGYITEAEAKAAALSADSAIATTTTGSEGYVADWIEGLVTDYIGDIKQDVVVHTTIDWNLQKAAEFDVREMVAKDGKARHFNQGALVAMSPDGEVRAMVGGADYTKSQYNRAITARRQTGSAFKPIVYLTALEHGYTPDTIVTDAPFSYNGWSPQNDNHKYVGEIPLRTALAYSINSVAARLAVELGPQTIVQTAMRMGISSPLQAVPSIALGTQSISLLELTQAYAPFANGGFSVIANPISEITTADGKVLYQATPPPPTQVVTPTEEGMMNNMLATVVDIGTGRSADLKGWQIAGKTGTSQKGRDAIFVGYSSHMVTGVWLGNDNDAPTRLTGGSLPAAIWTEFMKVAHKGITPAPLPGNYTPSPEDLQAEQELEAQQGQIPGDYVPPDQQGPGVPQPGTPQAQPKARSIGDLLQGLFGNGQ